MIALQPDGPELRKLGEVGLRGEGRTTAVAKGIAACAGAAAEVVELRPAAA